MAKRTKMSEEERKGRARRRWRLKHGWTEMDFPVPNDGKLRTPLLPCIAVDHPLTDQVMFPPERKRGQKKSPAPPEKPRLQLPMDFDEK